MMRRYKPGWWQTERLPLFGGRSDIGSMPSGPIVCPQPSDRIIGLFGTCLFKHPPQAPGHLTHRMQPQWGGTDGFDYGRFGPHPMPHAWLFPHGSSWCYIRRPFTFQQTLSWGSEKKRLSMIVISPVLALTTVLLLTKVLPDRYAISILWKRSEG